MLSGDTTTRIEANGVICAAAIADTLEQVRVKLDGVIKDNLHAAGEVRGQVSKVVDANSELSRRTNEHAASLVESVNKVTAVVAEIEAASREQATGIEQINSAIMQMDTMTQEDARMAQELTSTAESLQAQSQQMSAAISAFSMQASHDGNRSSLASGPATRTHDSEVRLRHVA